MRELLWGAAMALLAAPAASAQHLYAGVEGSALIAGLPAGWSTCPPSSAIGKGLALHVQLEGEHLFGALSALGAGLGSVGDDRAGSRGGCQGEVGLALEGKLGYAFGDRSWAPYLALGIAVIDLVRMGEGASASGPAASLEGGILLFRDRRWGQAMLAVNVLQPFFGSSSDAPSLTLLRLALRLMI